MLKSINYKLSRGSEFLSRKQQGKKKWYFFSHFHHPNAYTWDSLYQILMTLIVIASVTTTALLFNFWAGQVDLAYSQEAIIEPEPWMLHHPSSYAKHSTQPNCVSATPDCISGTQKHYYQTLGNLFVNTCMLAGIHWAAYYWWWHSLIYQYT